MGTERRYRLDKTDCAAPELSTVILAALNDAALGPERINRVVLVGGATRMQAVRAYAGRKFRHFWSWDLTPIM